MSEKQMDLMIPLSKYSRWDNNELRYALRAYQQYWPEMGRVFVVGVKPSWLTGVEHLHVRDLGRGRGKDTNIMRKILHACRNGIGEMFLRGSDDQVLLRGFESGELVPIWEDDQQKFIRWAKTNPGWYKRFDHTLNTLQDKGLPTHCYDLHIPQPYNRDDVRALLEDTDLSKKHYVVHTWILNHTAMDSKEGIPIGLWYRYSQPTDSIKKFLTDKFPEPSQFESDRPLIVPVVKPACQQRLVVALLTCDRLEYTRRTVESLLKHHPPGTLMLFHADDASTDPEVCRYVQSRGFDTIVANTTRMGCSRTTELLMRAVAERVQPETMVIYLQNDFECLRPLPVLQLNELIARPDVEHVQLSYRHPRSAYNKATIWKTEDGRLWPFGDQTIAPVVYGGFNRGVGYHPSVARIETWVRNVSGVKRESDFISQSERQDKQACRLTTPVFEHRGKQTTPNGRFGYKRKTRRAVAVAVTDESVVISLTTTPSRGPQIEPVLDRLLAQGPPVYLWVPRQLTRTGETWDSIPKFFNKVRWEFVDDQGPITKLLPALYLHDIVITADDDVYYGEGWASGLLEWAAKLPNAAVAYRGRQIQEGVSYAKSRVIRRPRRPHEVSLITGVFGALYRKSFFSHTIFSEWQQCPTNDDVVISAHLMKRGVPMTVVPMRCDLSDHKRLQRTAPLMWHNNTGPTDEGLRNVYWQGVPSCQ